MFLFPIVGHLIFLIFGKIYYKRQDLQSYHQRKTFAFEIFKPEKNRLLQDHSRISKRGVYNADFTFFEDGNEAFTNLFNAIARAQNHIHMHWYIIKSGEIYDQWKDLIINKAKAGVEVRLIVDSFGSWALPYWEIKELRAGGVEIQFFEKVYFPFIHSPNVYRTHRKVVIVDGVSVFIGGINIGDEYASLSHWYGRWLDLQARITGEAVRSHALLFIEDWKQITGQWLDPQKYLRADPSGDNRTVLIEDSPEIQQNIAHDTILNLILNARQSITITTPYFVLTQTIIDALRLADQKGIIIKIFVPGLHDKILALKTSYYYIYSLLDTNIKFYKTKSTFLHTKAGIFDDSICYFGTINLDKRSFYSQLEAFNLFYGPATKKLAQVIKGYEKITTKIDKPPRFWKYQKWILKFFVNIFSPLI